MGNAALDEDVCVMCESFVKNAFISVRKFVRTNCPGVSAILKILIFFNIQRRSSVFRFYFGIDEMEGGIEKYFLKIYSIQLLSFQHLNGYQTFNRLRA